MKPPKRNEDTDQTIQHKNQTKPPAAAIETADGYGDKKLDTPNRPAT